MRDNPIGRIGVAFAAFLAIGELGSGSAHAQQDMAALVRQSGFIFAGRIEKVGAATVGLSASPDTAIVRIVRVIDRQPPVDEIAGHVVTVRLRNAEQAKPGQQVVFFTYLYGGGRSLGLDEVAELSDSDAIDQTVHAARTAIADGALRTRLDSATIVAVAKVLRTARVPAPSPRDEHEPMWWTATLEVASVLKGDAAKGTTITVRFPSNYDAYWGAAPKPEPGDTAIFLMQPARMVPSTPEEAGERGEQKELTGLFLVDRLDEVGVLEFERVRRLLIK